MVFFRQHFEPLVMMLQGVSDHLIDQLFNSDAGRLMFVAMILAILANVATVILMLRWFRSAQDASNKVQTQLTNSLDRMTTTLDNNQSYLERVRDEAADTELNTRLWVDRHSAQLNTIVTSVSSNQAAVAGLLIDESNLHSETRAFFKKTLAEMLDEMRSQNRLDIFNEFNNPTPDDCRWKVKLVRSSNGSELINLLIVPILKDNNHAGQIRGGGEVVKIIEATVLPGWAIIQQLYGESPATGYVRRHLIEIQDLPIDDGLPKPVIITPTEKNESENHNAT